jgi:HSP20 family protein
MTTTQATDTTSNNERSGRGCGPRGCGPRGGAGSRFGGPFGYHFAAKFGGPGSPFARFQAPVNIEETSDAYILSLYAAGLDKSALQVSAQGDVLTIRYQAKEDADNARKFTRREQAHSSFEREFALNGKVQIDAIAASYNEGVLTVRLPKTPEAQQPGHEVPVQ